MSKQTLYMETTEISATRTAGEITSELVRAGATQVATDYKDGKVTGLRWTMRLDGRDLLFAMPARVEPIFKILKKRVKWPTTFQDIQIREKAERIAWRQLLRWVQAQLAMIECGMTEAAEVFFPFTVDPRTEQTFFQVFRERQQLALPAGEEKPQ